MLVALQLVLALTALVGPAANAAESPVLIPSAAETVPTQHAGDSMDDPAVWVHPTQPDRSLLIGNDKLGALETYDLDGTVVQRLGVGNPWGNVDVRQGLTIGAFTGDLVAGVSNGVRLYTVDPADRLLSPVNDGTPDRGLGEGLCMYQSPTTDKVYGISITIQGILTQYEILDSDANGLLETSIVRTFDIGSEAEGCVADDDTGALYVSEEDVALWRYSAEPSGGSTREAVDVLLGSGGHLANDIEGLALVDQADGGGYLIASAQNVANPHASYFSVYRRDAGNDFVNTFRVADGVNSDDCDRTDGITAVTADLGPAFPRGMFVCQDNNNDLPGTSGNQDLKMVRLEKIVNLDGGGPPPPPPPPPPVSAAISFVGQSSVDTNSKSFSVTTPLATQLDDALLLFVSTTSTVTLTGPGTGWTQVGNRVVDNTLATTVWRRQAVAADAGKVVRLTSRTLTKASVTLASYRGVDTAAPIAVVAAAGEFGNTAAHKTPVVPSTTAGAWRVSYWADKNSATTAWAAPAGETRRAATTGTGSGRFSSLLTDPGTALTAGTPANTGGLVATATASASAASMWTMLLRPATAAGPINQPPVARFTWDCVDLTCTFDGSTSTDFEDSISAYDWVFDDGTAGDQMTQDHTYAAAGTYVVSLTVTDNVGATNTVQHSVVVGAVGDPISFVGQASVFANSTSVSVQVPSNVVAGDALLLFTSQGQNIELTAPSGWTEAGRVVDGDAATTIWHRIATAADADSTVRLSVASMSKNAVTVAAYRGTSTTRAPEVAGVAEPGTSASHTTPSVPNDVAGAWRISYWSDKNSATTRWEPPTGETTRASTYGTGGGRVGSLLTDSSSALVAGVPTTTGGLTATADATASSATSWTVLLRPAG